MDDVTFPEIREAVARLCAGFPGEYWRKLDQTRTYPTEFVQALTREGWLGGLIPENYGGSGLGLEAAGVVLEEIHRSGGNGGAAHAQMYTMGAILKHGSPEQKQRYLPPIARGELRLQAFGVTEPDAGTDTTRITTFARREGDKYIVNGQKIWISRAEHSDLMLLLCRTTPRDQVAKPTDGMSVLIVDMREALGRGPGCIRPIRTMINHATTELFFDDMEVPVANLVGVEGQGFRYILDGMNAEQVLIALRMYRRRQVRPARQRPRPTPSWLQGVRPGPSARTRAFSSPSPGPARATAKGRRADQVRDAGHASSMRCLPLGTEANMAKMLASEASAVGRGRHLYPGPWRVRVRWRIMMVEAPSSARHGFYQVAPISTNLILSHVATHVLGLPKSF